MAGWKKILEANQGTVMMQSHTLCTKASWTPIPQMFQFLFRLEPWRSSVTWHMFGSPCSYACSSGCSWRGQLLSASWNNNANQTMWGVSVWFLVQNISYFTACLLEYTNYNPYQHLPLIMKHLVHISKTIISIKKTGLKQYDAIHILILFSKLQYYDMHWTCLNSV